MSWKRPTSSETEEDLLKLQEQFLASKEKPSAGYSGTKRKLLKNTTSLESQSSSDTPPLSILRDIKERNVCNWSSSVSCLESEKGFPVVHEIPKEEVITLKKLCKNGSPASGKKSLFAQQFESLGPQRFGLVKKNNSPLFPALPNVIKRDYIDPMSFEPVSLPKPKAKESISIDYDNASSVAWDRFLQPSLVSGEGLCAANTASGREEVKKIHEENVAQLSKMSEEEIIMEQNKLKQQLGPELVQFLTSRKNVSKQNSKLKVINEQDQDSKGTGISTKWLHMDRVEKEKLEWMKDVPIGTSTGQDGCREVRFSMDGMVIRRSAGAAIPTHLGLHHHGDEPEAAGYTLKELVHLSCSSILQQRAVSLKTLAIILNRARHNEYAGVIEDSTTEVLLESSLPKILRYALDDSTKNIQTEAIHGIHSLLVSLSEEEILNTYSDCYQGLSLPRSSSFVPSRTTSSLEEDQDTLKEDVVGGLLQMMLLPRLRYILEVCQPPFEVTTMLLEILIVVVRHSPHAANKVLTCPRLVNAVRDLLTVEEKGDSKKPHPKAMKLIRTLCASGRHTSATMLTRYNILEPVLRYCVIRPSAHCLPPSESHQLYVEAARTWTVLMSYGLTTDTFSDIFPTLLQLLLSHLPLSSMGSDELLQYSAIFNLLTASVHVSAITPAMLGTRPSLSLSWAHAQGLVDPALSCLNSVLREIGHFKDAKDCSLDRIQYISSTQHLVATYYTELMDKPELRDHPVDLLQQVESLTSSIIMKFESSIVYEIAVEMLCSCLETPPTGPSVPSSLPVLIELPPSSPALFGHASINECSQPCLVHVTVIVFADLLRSHFRLLQSFLHLHKGIAPKLLQLLTSDKVLRLLKCFNRLKPQNSFWFLTPLYCVMDLVIKGLLLGEYDSIVLSPDTLKLIHSCAFKLLASLPPGLEALSVELMTTILFRPLLYGPVDGGASLISRAVSLLPLISKSYIACLEQFSGIDSKSIASSLFWLKHNPVHVDSLQLPCYKKPHLPTDWPYLPLLVQYNISQSGKTGISTTVIGHALQYILLMECIHGDVMETIPIATRVVRIMCVFLTGSDLFFDEAIRPLLAELLLYYSSKPIQFFYACISGLPSFPDLFVSLLDQYSAVSYGDGLYAQYILLAIQQNQSSILRRLFWLDHSHITRIFTVGLNEISIPIRSFLYPVELEWDLVHKYLRLLVSDSITWRGNPLLYLIALHHVHHFVFHEAVQLELRRKMLERVVKIPSKALAKAILLYSRLNEDNTIQHSDSLTTSQEKFLDSCGHHVSLLLC